MAAPTKSSSSTAQSDFFGDPPQHAPETRDRPLQMVERAGDGSLAPAEYTVQSFASNAPDLGAVLAALPAAEPTLLSKEGVDLLFEGRFPPSSRAAEQLQRETEGCGAPAGVPADLACPPVNWSAAGLAVEEELPVVRLPAGSVTWDGMPNVVWAMNREREPGVVFATQLLPTGTKGRWRWRGRSFARRGRRLVGGGLRPRRQDRWHV
jgi:hypothetical protein